MIHVTNNCCKMKLNLMMPHSCETDIPGLSHFNNNLKKESISCVKFPNGSNKEIIFQVILFFSFLFYSLWSCLFFSPLGKFHVWTYMYAYLFAVNVISVQPCILPHTVGEYRVKLGRVLFVWLPRSTVNWGSTDLLCSPSFLQPLITAGTGNSTARGE